MAKLKREKKDKDFIIYTDGGVREVVGGDKW
jgi:hypothetical protein